MNVGFIGSGNMAFAILSGGLDHAVLSAAQTITSDPSADRREIIASLGVRSVENNATVCSTADIIFFCVKPQHLDSVLKPLADAFDPQRHCLVSILAGVPTRRLEALTPDGLPVIRVMPNTPMLVGRGVSAISAGRYATDAQTQKVSKILASCSTVLHIDETMMDAVTAISGSGPAYLFYLAEAMTAGAVENGFDIETANVLVRETLLGASELLAGSDKTASELRAMVTSKGGTTAAAINIFDASGAQPVIVQAINAARTRSCELGKE